MKAIICNISLYKISLKRLVLPNKGVKVHLKWKGETGALNPKPWFRYTEQAGGTEALHTIPVQVSNKTSCLYVDNTRTTSLISL